MMDAMVTSSRTLKTLTRWNPCIHCHLRFKSWGRSFTPFWFPIYVVLLFRLSEPSQMSAMVLLCGIASKLCMHRGRDQGHWQLVRRSCSILDFPVNALCWRMCSTLMPCWTSMSWLQVQRCQMTLQSARS